MKHSALLIIQTLPPGKNKSYKGYNAILFSLHNKKAKENSMSNSDTLLTLTSREEKWFNSWMENYLRFPGFSISCFERSYDYAQNEPADFISMRTDQSFNKFFSHLSSFLRNLNMTTQLCATSTISKFGKTSISTPQHLNYTSNMNWPSVMTLSYLDNYDKTPMILYVNSKTCLLTLSWPAQCCHSVLTSPTLKIQHDMRGWNIHIFLQALQRK